MLRFFENLNILQDFFDRKKGYRRSVCQLLGPNLKTNMVRYRNYSNLSVASKDVRKKENEDRKRRVTVKF